MFRIHVDGRVPVVALVIGGLPLASHCHAAAVVPMIAQAGAALVQPGGLQGLAQGAANPAARPEMVQADPQAEQPKPADAAAPATDASPFEIRYLIAYVMMLIFIGGGTGLVVRPTGRTRQHQDKASTPPTPAAKK